MLKPLDKFLNTITMYTLVYYGLMALLGVAVVLGFLGQLPYSGWSIGLSSLGLLTVCRVVNIIFAKLFNATTNFESPAISALILTFVLAPASTAEAAITLALTAAVAMASKYLLAWRGRHIFNPAAAGLVIMSLLGSGQAAWWVATPVMLPATALLGFLVVRKLQRQLFVLAAMAAALIAMVIAAAVQGFLSPSTLTQAFTSWPLVFFATIMLTEPSTQPATRSARYIYAVVVGALFGSQLHIGGLSTTPHLVLVLGNVLSYIMSRPRHLRLRLAGQRLVAPNVHEFSFTPNQPLRFKPGQYLEWTLMHPHADLRGSRRYFTIASSPTEPQLRLTTKIGPARTSSFKTALQGLKPQASLTANGPAGDFTLPADTKRPLVWLAGGIGVTPFRAQARYLLDRQEHRDIHLLYVAAAPDAFAFQELFDEAQSIGLRAHYILFGGDPAAPWDGLRGPLTADLLHQVAPDCASSEFYISGPSGFVQAQRRLLASLHIPRTHIHTDDFPGL